MIQLMRTQPRLAPVREMLNSLADGFAGSSMPGSLPLDIIEKSDCYEIQASVPGLTRDQITLEVEKGVLTISAVVTETIDTPDEVTSEAATTTESGCGCGDENDSGCCMLRRERFFGSAKRSLRLPTDVDDALITANLDRGILTIMIQKPAEKTPKTVQID